MLATAVIVSLALATSALHTIELPPYRPLTLASGKLDIPTLLGSTSRALQRYHVKRRSSHPSLRKRRNGLDLFDCVLNGVDTGYSGNITIHNNASQDFTMLFDTGSSDIVLPGPKCGVPPGTCGNVTYNELGTSAHTQVEIQYEGAGGIGDVFRDDVTVAGLTARDQAVLSLNSAAGIQTHAFDGIFGMGSSRYSVSNSYSFFETLLVQDIIKAPDRREFSFYLGRGRSNTGDESALTLGGRDESKFKGAITSVPVNNKSGWVVPVASVSVGGQLVGKNTAGLATVDTGTTLIITTVKNANDIFSKIPGSQPIPIPGSPNGNSSTNSTNQSYYYAFPCNTPSKLMPAFTFSLTGRVPLPNYQSPPRDLSKPMAIDHQDFNLGLVETATAGAAEDAKCSVPGRLLLADTLGDTCMSAIMGSGTFEEGDNLYVLGDAWLKGWWSVYGYDDSGMPASVGFAQSTAFGKPGST